MEALNLHKPPQVAQMLFSQYNASESKIVFERYHNFCDHQNDISHPITERTTAYSGYLKHMIIYISGYELLGKYYMHMLITTHSHYLTHIRNFEFV